jgi:hypothetical protein
MIFKKKIVQMILQFQIIEKIITLNFNLDKISIKYEFSKFIFV